MSTDKITLDQLKAQGFTVAELPDNLGMSLYGRENLEYIMGFDPYNDNKEIAIISIQNKVATYSHRPFNKDKYENDVAELAKYFNIDPKWSF